MKGERVSVGERGEDWGNGTADVEAFGEEERGDAGVRVTFALGRSMCEGGAIEGENLPVSIDSRRE